MLPCPVCWGSAEHVGLVCVDGSGTMDPGEDDAPSRTRAGHMKSHKFILSGSTGFSKESKHVCGTLLQHAPAL